MKNKENDIKESVYAIIPVIESSGKAKAAAVMFSKEGDIKVGLGASPLSAIKNTELNPNISIKESEDPLSELLNSLDLKISNKYKGVGSLIKSGFKNNSKVYESKRVPNINMAVAQIISGNKINAKLFQNLGVGGNGNKNRGPKNSGGF